MADQLTFDPFDASQTQHMWDLARRFRREAPVARIGGGFVFVSRYHDARTVVRNNTVFSNAGGFKLTGLELAPEDQMLGDIDPPEHVPLRKLAFHAVSGPGVVESARPFAAEVSADLAGALRRRGGGDLIGEFSLALTNRVIARMLGVPVDDGDWLAERGEEIMMSDLPITNRTERGVGYMGAFPEFTTYLEDLIRERLGTDEPPDDAITRIATVGADEVRLPVPMIRMIMVNLVLGGTTTTRDLLGSLFLEVMRRPELHEALRADHGLIVPAVEEGLRLAPPVLFLIRTCAVDTELQGVSIRAGERVIAGIAAANRDEDVYDDPDEFRVDRVDPPPHLSFGHGSHLCVGNGLARMEAQEALAVFVDRFEPGELRLAEGFDMEMVPSPFLYGPKRLDVELATAGR